MTPSKTTHTITQVSILNAVLARRFDGLLPCKELLEHGDFGIGTFDQMDGEMIIVDGVIYQGKLDGRVYVPDLENRTPFATVCNFLPDETWTLTKAVDYSDLDKSINEKATNPNVFYAIRVEGRFSYMKTHSLVKQEKPYPSTADVVKGCVQSELRDVSGTIVGFRGAPHLRGINDTGFHLHFITEDRTRGGHVLEFVMDQGSCAINICNNHVVMLPENGKVLEGIDMTQDLVGEFHKALSNAS
jgi:acetolactate decarboxylase